MEEKNNIRQELENIAPALKNLPEQMLYDVPDGYFDSLPLELLGKINKPEANPAVPGGYFDALPEVLLSRIKLMEPGNELDSVAPALTGLSRKMPYAVPTGYFENLRVNVNEVITEVPVIQIRKKISAFWWVAAASVLLLAGVFAWQHFGGHTIVVAPAVATATEVTDTAISAALADIEDTSISQELSSNGVEKNTQSAVYYLHSDSIETALRELTDEEIQTQLASTAVVKNKS